MLVFFNWFFSVYGIYVFDFRWKSTSPDISCPPCYLFIIEKPCRHIIGSRRERRPDKHTLIFFRYFFIVKHIK